MARGPGAHPRPDWLPSRLGALQAPKLPRDEGEQSSVIIVQSHITMKHGHESQVLEAADRMAEAARRRPGCISYRCYSGVSEPTELLLLQEWRDLEALRDHYRGEHMRDFLAALEDLVDGEVVTKRYSVEDERPQERPASRGGPQVH